MMRENPDPDIIFMEPCTTTQTQQLPSLYHQLADVRSEKNASRTS